MFNCVPTIEAVSIHLLSASQQRLVIAFMFLSTIKIHMVPYKYTHEAFLQFPTLVGKSPKWNILVVTSELVICLKYMHGHEGPHLCPLHIGGILLSDCVI